MNGPIFVTLAYVLVYYLFQTNQLRVKTKLRREYKARGERFDRYFNQDREMLAADRYVLNTLEHMGPFLALLWLNAIYVSPLIATIAGGIYVTSRALYPLLMGKALGGNVPTRIMLTTVPGYLVLAFFAGALVVARLS